MIPKFKQNVFFYSLQNNNTLSYSQKQLVQICTYALINYDFYRNIKLLVSKDDFCQYHTTDYHTFFILSI